MRQLMLAAVVFLIGASSSLAQGHMGSPQEQQACRRDAQRFCRQQLADDNAVQQCLQQNRAKLSKACAKVFQSHGM
ncbi:cysteine rich repeat-containing protein [Bradyrhizobium erythrophlei]|uniref:cysteine rich repeat-containing protein n=1 Tax=Bradyrhizobium erythrophlei TaxID=1437360 RepID=UPI0035E4E65B